MGWAARANSRDYSAPKVNREREHFKHPEFKAQWGAFSERVGIHVATPRVRTHLAAIVRRVFVYRRKKES